VKGHFQYPGFLLSTSVRSRRQSTRNKQNALHQKNSPKKNPDQVCSEFLRQPHSENLILTAIIYISIIDLYIII
jgi:hypothetical protein